MLTNNPTQMDSYNKQAKNGQGTPPLIQAPSWPTGSNKGSIVKSREMAVQSPEPISLSSMMIF